MELFNTPIGTPLLIVLTVLYFIVASVETFDIRIIQANRQGANLPNLPNWVIVFHILLWVFWILIFLLNWKYAFILFGIKFILKVLPVLETIGNILMSPFSPNKKK